MMIKNSHIKLTAILMAIAFFLSSCASIVSKSTYPVSINTNPSDAKVTITDKKGMQIYSGNTPATVPLKAGAGFFSKAEYQMRLSSPGYDDRIVPITFTIDGWYFGNIVLGGILGMLIIDPATGAMWKIERSFFEETLKQTNASTNPEIRIMDINEVPESWESHLVKVRD